MVTARRAPRTSAPRTSATRTSATRTTSTVASPVAINTAASAPSQASRAFGVSR